MLRHRPLLFVFVAVAVSCCLEQASSFPRNRNVIACKGIKLTKLGCHRDNMKSPRPLPQLILTDRDTTSPVYSNVLINWRKWNDYMIGLICRCASKSLSKGYNVMGLQYYGECWSGAKSATSKYARDGPSQNCITFNFKPCKPGLDCVGKDKANFVYRVEKDTPSGSPTKKPTTKKTTPTQSITPKPTPSNTPSSSPSPTPPSTPSPSPSPFPSTTPPSTPSPSSSAPSTTPRSPSASPTPSGSATSTAKRPNVPTSSQSPCKASSCSAMGQQHQQPQCFPHCQPAVMLPLPPVIISPPLYPGGTDSQQQGCPQSMCPVQCAPQCTTSCCNSV